MEHLFGIDLGTTNSALAIYKSGNVSEIIPLKDTDGSINNTMPSCVMWLGGDNWVVGYEAYKNRYRENVAYSIKSKIGKDYIHTFRYNNEEIKKTPIEISALILKGICEKAQYLYPEIKKVTITVPAEFGHVERLATKQAGELAGLDVVDIINEPTAAALRYDVTKTKEVLVYDLGGGTYDLTQIKITAANDINPTNLNFKRLGIDLTSNWENNKGNPKYEVVYSCGDRSLGGDDLDDYALKLILNDFINDESIDKDIRDKFINPPKEIYENLKLQVSNIKKGIASENTASAIINLNVFGFNANMQVTRPHFVAATKIIYDKTNHYIKEIMRKSKSSISELILIGGSTKNKILVEMLEDDYGDDLVIVNNMNPDESVALGAALKTAVTLNLSGINVVDAAPYTVGIEVHTQQEDGTLIGGKIERLIRKGESIPRVVEKRYSLEDADSDIELNFYTGEGMRTESCNFLCSHTLQKKKKNLDSILMIVTVDAQGVLHLKMRSGSDEWFIDINNVFNNKDGTTKKSPREKMVLRWKAQLQAKNITITKEIENHFNEFITTGDKNAKKAITDLFTEKTNLFG